MQPDISCQWSTDAGTTLDWYRQPLTHRQLRRIERSRWRKFVAWLRGD